MRSLFFGMLRNRVACKSMVQQPSFISERSWFSAGILRIDRFQMIGLVLLVCFLNQRNVMGDRIMPEHSFSGQVAFSFLPSPIPQFPPGSGSFGKGSIDLGGLNVCRVSAFDKVWTTLDGGPDNQGSTFYEPSGLPDGYFMLGSYSQANNKPNFDHVLAVRDEGNGVVAKPVDYTLVWSSEKSQIQQNGTGYVWFPVAPEGYKALGHIVTATANKPSVDSLRCVRADFTEQCQAGELIWGQGNDVVSIVEAKPVSTGLGVPVGTFAAQDAAAAGAITLSCLKINNTETGASMPDANQIKKVMKAYGPSVYLHPDEEFFPSSVSWFFDNGALLYQRGNESNPLRIDTRGSNLPQGGSNDGAFWLDHPVDTNVKELVKKGNLSSFEAYLHVKPTRGGTITDIVIWLFYPYNGAAKAKIEFFNKKLGRIGSHVGDWEHLTLRISNFNGELLSVYFSEHSSGKWISASQLEYQNENRPIAYASHHSHALYPKPGLVLLGDKHIGIRDDMAKSNFVMDVGARFEIVSAEYLGIVEPPWLNYFRKWGPEINYGLAGEINGVTKMLPGKLKKVFESFVRGLPNEVLGQDGPTGPKVKASWDGDEV